MTGDDQASTIHTALSNLEGSTDDEGQPSTAASRDAAGAVAVAKAAAAEDEAGGVPHRWQVVGMMALSFVLCNMDKVSGYLSLCWHGHLWMLACAGRGRLRLLLLPSKFMPGMPPVVAPALLPATATH
jgi:hypothetical protein